MQWHKTILLGVLCLGMAGFSRAGAKAVILNAQGKAVGTAFFSQDGANVQMSLRVKGLTPGDHAIHIHGAGKCEGPDFKSAGPHFNPSGKKHGLKNPEGHHRGDLPNLTANKRGRVKAKIVVENVSLQPGEENSLLQAGGTSVVIHEGPDDEITDPAGNSGGRIACGVIEKA